MNNMHEDLRIIIDKYCNSSKVETHSVVDVNIIENEDFINPHTIYSTMSPLEPLSITLPYLLL
jgi:hypothetical protein